jgi:hypothetical protein
MIADPIATCVHHWIYDVEFGEAVCQRCGLAIPAWNRPHPTAPDDQSQIVSPGLVGGGLGTDLDESVRELNGHSTDGEEREEDGGRSHRRLLQGALRRVFDGSQDESFWISLTEQLRQRGMDETRVALACATLRRQIARMRRKDMQTIKELVAQAWGIEL